MKVERMPRPSSARFTTAAPAPSPKSTQVVRSVQSTMDDIFSVAQTSTVSACPATMCASAMERP
jgi:hypothetical protein